MIEYLVNFTVYTLAMTGLLVIGYVIYKKFMIQAPVRKNSTMKVIDVLRLQKKKTLYLIKCRDEQFLIASSTDKISFISKVNEDFKHKNNERQIERYLSEKFDEEFEDSNNPYLNKEPKNKKYVIKSLLKELSDKNQTKRGNY